MSQLYVSALRDEELPADEAWFQLELPDGVVQKYKRGDAALIRRFLCESLHSPLLQAPRDYRCLNFCRRRADGTSEMIYDYRDIICGELLHLRVDPVTYDIQIRVEKTSETWTVYHVAFIDVVPNDMDQYDDNIDFHVYFAIHWNTITDQYILQDASRPVRMCIGARGHMEIYEHDPRDIYDSLDELLQYGLHKRPFNDRQLQAVYKALRPVIVRT